MITESRICDTVCKLASAGKRLPANLPGGKDPYEAMCESFCTVFGDRDINPDVWNEAELNYIKSQAMFISPAYMEEEIRNIQKTTTRDAPYDWLGGLDEKTFFRRKRTASRLWKFAERMYAMKIKDPNEYLPDTDEAIQIGLKHGFTEDELRISTREGGQLLAIKAFVAEYRGAKAMGYNFPYKMQIVNREVVWGEADGMAN